MKIPKTTLSAIFRAIRNEFIKSEAYKDCIQANSSRSGPKGGLRTKCTLCKRSYLPKEIEVDHMEDSQGPVVPFHLFYYQMCVYDYYDRVFNVLKIRPLCKPCHSKTTSEQNIKRKEIKKQNESTANTKRLSK